MTTAIKDPQLDLYPKHRVKPDLRDVAVEDIDRNSLVGAKPTAEFKESVYKLGILQAVLLKHDEGRYIVIEGRRRVQAAIETAMHTVPAMVVEAKDWIDSEVGTLAANEFRSTNYLAKIEAIEQLIGKGYSDKSIAYLGGVKTSELTRQVMPVLKLDKLFRQALVMGKISPAQAIKIATKVPPEKHKKLLGLLGDKGRLTGADIDGYIGKDDGAKTEDMFDGQDLSAAGTAPKTIDPLNTLALLEAARDTLVSENATHAVARAMIVKAIEYLRASDIGDVEAAEAVREDVADAVTCEMCAGDGWVTLEDTIDGGVASQQTCPTCGGEGTTRL